MDYRAHNRIRFASRGQALVPVIFVMLILTTLAITFATSAHREIRASSNFNAQTERYFATQGALNYAMSALAQTSNNGATYGIVPASADTDSNGWMQIGDAWVKIDAVDTAGLINLNTVTQTTLNQIPVLQQNPDVVAAMLDWRSTSTQPSTNGAKSEYYNTLTPSYDSKNGPYDSVEELLLVKGVTPTILYGTPGGTVVDPTTLANQANSSIPGGTGSIGSSSPTRQAGALTRQATRPTRQGAGGPPITSQPGGLGAGGGATGGGAGTGGGTGTGTGGTATAAVGDTDWTDIYNASTMPLSEMFTTLAWERNVASDGTVRVNINTAALADLTAIGMAQNLANALIRYRTGAASGTGTGTGTGTGGAGAGGGTPRPGGGGGGGGPRVQSRGALGLPNFQPTRQGAGGPPITSQPGGLGSIGGGNGGGARPGGGGNGGGQRPGGGAGGGPGGGAGAGGGTGTGGTGTTATAFASLADLLNVAGFTQPVLQQIADKLSTDDKSYHADLVNINTASQEVLAAVPGMDHTTLQAIIAYRQGGQAFQSIGDFFALQGLTRQQFQNVVAHLTTKSSFYRVRVRVLMPGQDSLYTVSAMVQLTENGPQILQWKEAQRSPGWAYWVPSPTLPTPSPTTSSTGSASPTPSR